MNGTKARVWISELEFNNGTKYRLNSDDIVIFVGANNVGKSKTLKEIGDRMMDSYDNINNSIMLKECLFDCNFNEQNLINYFSNNFPINDSGAYSVYTNNSSSPHCFTSYHFSNFSNMKKSFFLAFCYSLSTENRLILTRSIDFNHMGELNSIKIYDKLRSSDYHIKQLNSYIYSSFKNCIDVYETFNGHNYLRTYKIGTKEQIDNTISLPVRESLSQLEHLDNLSDQGDGIRSAVGILASLIVNDQSVFLIDEPEAFLHPPQAKMLGKEIVELSIDKQCFISTHNIDLIRGLLETKSKHIKIIKINRNENVNEFHLLDNDDLLEIANDKNLKYSNILNGLFYGNVILCENESDCKLYSAVLEQIDSDLYQNTLFCAVGGKDQFKMIIPSLKKLNINYSVIADIDLINDIDKLEQLINCDGSDDYSIIREIHKEFINKFKEKMYDSLKTQEEIKDMINNMFTEDKYMSEETNKQIMSLLKTVSKFKILKNGGEGIIPSGSCSTNYLDLKKFLNERHIYLVPCGEIERFFMEIDSHGDAFVNELFDKYPDLQDLHYEGVRNFLKEVFNI